MADPVVAQASDGGGYSKLVAGSTASVIGGALTTVIASLITGIDPSYHFSAELEGAVQTLVTMAVTAGAIYFAPR